MYTIQRWIKVLLLVLVLVSMNAWAEEEGRHEGAVAEEYVETETYEEAVSEDAEIEEEPEAVQEEEIVEEVVPLPEIVEEVMVKETTDANLLDGLKSKLSSVVDAIVSKSKSIIERCKSMSKADIKKVAAAAVGIWGVAVGVGYLTKGSPPPPAKSGISAKKK
jgi:hypothetical protein